MNRRRTAVIGGTEKGSNRPGHLGCQGTAAR